MPDPLQGATQSAQQFEAAYQAFEEAARGGGLLEAEPARPRATTAPAAGPSPAEGFDPCTQWKNARPAVNDVVAALQALGGLFPVAKKAADVIQTLVTLLNQLCQ